MKVLKQYLENLISLLNKVSPLKLILIYFIFSIFLMFKYTQQTNYNLNLLLHINQRYIELNPELKFSHIVILKNEGYDGQFYYFIARYIYDKQIDTITVDSSSFRILRIGSSLLYGIIPSLIGWEFYSYWVIFVHFVLFFISFYIFYKILPNSKKYIAIIYLYNPFTIISNMLLIGDALFISLFIILYYFLKKINFTFKDNYKIQFNLNYIISLILFLWIILIKETALFYLCTFLFIFIYKKDRKGILLTIIPILFYFIWLFIIFQFTHFKDVSSISHLERIRIPFLEMLRFYINFLKNIQNINDLLKFVYYIIILLCYISLVLQIFNFIKINKVYKILISIFKFNITPDIKEYILKLILILPILFIIIIIPVVDFEYWLSFDNIFRIFAFAFLWIIILDTETPYKVYGLYSFLIFTTLGLIVRYTFIKKIGEFIIL